MKLEGTCAISASRETVWKFLMDPETLAKALPGCERFEADSAGGFRATLKVGLAAIKGTYQGRVEIFDRVPPERYRMKIEGQGTGGFIKGEGSITLRDSAGGTELNYAGEAHVGGILAAVGQRLILGAAKQIVNQFFEAFAGRVRSANA